MFLEFSWFFYDPVDVGLEHRLGSNHQGLQSHTKEYGHCYEYKKELTIF